MEILTVPVRVPVDPEFVAEVQNFGPDPLWVGNRFELEVGAGLRLLAGDAYVSPRAAGTAGGVFVRSEGSSVIGYKAG